MYSRPHEYNNTKEWLPPPELKNLIVAIFIISINKGIVHVKTYIRHLHGGNDHRPILGGETVLVGSFIGCRSGWWLMSSCCNHRKHKFQYLSQNSEWWLMSSWCKQRKQNVQYLSQSSEWWLMSSRCNDRKHDLQLLLSAKTSSLAYAYMHAHVSLEKIE